ncbi:porin [Alcanivorax sp. MM125-6]|nr:porin [Alcanivorax sp. MM125-6]
MKLNSKVAKSLGAATLMGASGMASADVEVDFYGLLDLFAGSRESAVAADDSKVLDAGGMTTSYVGFNATADINESTLAFAKAEMFLRPDTGDDGRYNGDEFFARAAQVGVQGDLGTFAAGRVSAPMFLPVIFSNPFGGSFVFSPAILHSYQGGNYGATVGDSGWSNGLTYTSPSMSGLTATVTYAFGEEEGEDSENKFGGNLVYRNGGLMLTAAAHSVKQGALNSGDSPGFGESGGLAAIGGGAFSVTDQDAYLVGASYDFEVIKVYGMFHSLDTDTTTGDVDVDTYQGGVDIPVGPGSVLASYANSDFEGDIDTERKTWTVGYDWIVNEQFDVYANYMNDDVDDLGDGDTYGVGARFKF